MRSGKRVRLALLAAIGVLGISTAKGQEMSSSSTLFAPLPAETILTRRAFADLKAWVEDDHAAAFSTFLVTCAMVLDGQAALRDARPPTEGLKAACLAARDLAAQGTPDRAAARAFFESQFQPVEIIPPSGSGFLTAYYEPEIEASLTKSEAFPVSILARPADLVTLKQGETRPGLDPALAAARQTPNGLVPYATRAQIWAGALNGQGLEIAWLRDEAELFITQVQGSARLKLRDGSTKAFSSKVGTGLREENEIKQKDGVEFRPSLVEIHSKRLVYAGRNGHPYTSIGRKMVEMGAMNLEEMSLAKLMAWLRADPARGRALMEQNLSYVFFALADAPADQGPIGGAGVPLTTGRSLAVDRTLWPYGLPIFIETSPLTPEGPRAPLDRLMIAQDTGSAIVGPARGDFFMGSGEAAGAKAGLVRDSMRFTLLVPRGDAP